MTLKQSIIAKVVLCFALIMSSTCFAGKKSDIEMQLNKALTNLSQGNIQLFLNAWADSPGVAMIDAGSMRVLSGKQEIRKFMTKEINPRNIKSFKIESANVKGNDNFAWFTCKLELTVKNKNGRVSTRRSNGIYLMVNQNGWKVLHLISPFSSFQR